MELSMDLWHLNNMKVVTLTYNWLSLIWISVILTNLNHHEISLRDFYNLISVIQMSVIQKFL